MKITDLILEDDFGGYKKFKNQSNELEKELQDVYDRQDIRVTLGQYHERDRGYGKMQVMQPEDLPSSLYANMKNFIEAKGFEITGGSNFGETDSDRYYYPDIKFEFDITK